MILEPHKISVVEKYVTIIDALPEKYLGAETVFLSNNCISMLDGLKQFRNLKTLSIANNCVSLMLHVFTT
jgi:Leucine-rich repeat (LRR) protein